MNFSSRSSPGLFHDGTPWQVRYHRKSQIFWSVYRIDESGGAHFDPRCVGCARRKSFGCQDGCPRTREDWDRAVAKTQALIEEANWLLDVARGVYSDDE